MRTVPLGELTESVTTWNPSREPDNEFHYIDLSAVDNASKAVTAGTPTLGSEAPSRARQLVAAGDVLVSTVRPNLNAVAVVPPGLDGATASTGFTVLRPTAELNGRYLFHWVRSPEFIADMVRKATGASYPAVSDRVVKGSTVPAPPLPEQRRIAAILDCADALRTTRRQVLSHLEDLIRANYFTMFGRAEWSSRPLVDLADSPDDIKCGPFGTQLNASEFRTSGVPLLGIKNVNAKFALPPFEFLDEATAARLSAYDLRPGDLVMTRKGTIGNCAIYPPALPAGVMHSDLLRARISPLAADVVFLEHHLQLSPRISRQIRMMSPGAVMPGINVTKLKQLQVDTPPIALQREFAVRVSVIDQQRTAVRRALALDDALLASLQSRAFRGEL